MRTTLDIENDVLAAARGLAATQGRSLGAVVSDLARAGLGSPVGSPAIRNGVILLPLRPDATPVTLDIVNRLRDESP